MGKFQEKKNEILTASKASKRKTFNEQQFNELGTALLNETGYQSTTYTVKKGELEEITSNPVADLRKPLIGDVLKKAGLDSAEVEKITETHQFPTLPLYPVVSAFARLFARTSSRFISLTVPVWAVYKPLTMPYLFFSIHNITPDCLLTLMLYIGTFLKYFTTKVRKYAHFL